MADKADDSLRYPIMGEINADLGLGATMGFDDEEDDQYGTAATEFVALTGLGGHPEVLRGTDESESAPVVGGPDWVASYEELPPGGRYEEVPEGMWYVDADENWWWCEHGGSWRRN